MAKANDTAISVLNDLIETCKDGANGFRTAAGAVEHLSLIHISEPTRPY